MFEPKEPMVPLALYTSLLEKYHALKLAGAVAITPRVQKPVIPPAPDETELALEATRLEWVQNLTASMVQQGVDEPRAKAWAEAQVNQMAAGLVPG